ncbi:MAG TPA: L,D-transpeptidase, partial [Anaerolineales bacterium]
MNKTVLDQLRSNPRARAPGSTQPSPRPPSQRPQRPPRRRLPLLLFLIIFGFVALGAAGWSAVNNPALASLLSVPVVTPTPGLPQQFWARAEVGRPVNTPTPLPSTVMVEVTLEPPAETPTEAIPAISAIIVEDSSVPNPPQTDTQGGEAPPSTSYSGSKYILVDISEQHLYAYENSELLYSFIASTGMNNATATGNFAVQSKIPNAYGSTWNIWMPNWLGI